MGNILSHHSSNVIDGFVLRLARVIDSVLRNINRRLSTLSSFFFSRVFGYDVVFASDPTTPSSFPQAGGGGGGERGPLMCVPGNVCLVPASRLQQRQLEKKRRSERRKRAEAAALGHEMIRKARGAGEKGAARRYEKMESTPSSPVVEKTAYSEVEMRKRLVQQSLGQVAKAPAPRAAEDRETAREREKGRLWIMGNVQPRQHSKGNSGGGNHRSQALPELVPEEKTLDEQVINRLVSPTSPSKSTNNVGAGKKPIHIQPRKSSRPPPPLVSAKIDPVVERESIAAEGGFDSGHLTMRKPSGTVAGAGLHQPTALRLPPGALSLGPSPWEAAFRHPFTSEHEQLPVLTSKAKQQLRRQVLDTHLESSPLPDSTAAVFIPSRLHTEEEEGNEGEDEYLHLAAAISRPPSRTRTPGLGGGAGMARRSFDAISLRSIDSTHTTAAAIDVKTLASKAVKEEKGRKVWKDQVNKFAMQRCLLQQQVQGERRLSTATLAGGVGVSDKALTRVRTQEGEAGAVERASAAAKARRGSSPTLRVTTVGMVGSTSVGANGRTTPVLRAESPLHAVVRS